MVAITLELSCCMYIYCNFNLKNVSTMTLLSPFHIFLTVSLYLLIYEQPQCEKWASDPGLSKALTSSRCLSICRTATAKLVSHTSGISCAHIYTSTGVPWIDLIQLLNAASNDSRTRSVLEKTVVWNCCLQGEFSSELWLTPPTSTDIQWTLRVCRMEYVWINPDNVTDQGKT